MKIQLISLNNQNTECNILNFKMSQKITVFKKWFKISFTKGYGFY